MTDAERQRKQPETLKGDPVRMTLEKIKRQERHALRKANDTTQLAEDMTSLEQRR